MQPEELAAIERSTYRTAVDHGLWDIMIGFYMLMMGLCIALHVPYLVGVFVAIFAPAWRSLRSSFLEPRIGYVQLSPKRKKQMYRAICMAVIAMALLIVVPIAIERYAGLRLGRMPGMPALLTGELLAVPVLIAGYVLELKRFYLYAALICAAMAAGFLGQIRYDGVIAATGLVIMSMGAFVLRAFLRRYPVGVNHVQTR